MDNFVDEVGKVRRHQEVPHRNQPVLFKHNLHMYTHIVGGYALLHALHIYF